MSFSLAAVSIGDSLQQGLDALFGFIPNLLGFLVILFVGYLIAKAVKTLIVKGLDKAGLDRSLRRSEAGRYVEQLGPGASAARLIGAVAFWFIFLFAVSAAIAALKIPALTAFIADIQAFLPNVIVAVLILVGAVLLAGALGALAGRMMGDTPTGRIVRAVVPGLVLAIGVFMVLDQLQIAPQIVTITYAGLIALLVLAGGLAFGLGGRDVAADMLRSAYDSGRENADQFKSDMRTGRERARQEADSAKAAVKSEAGARAAEPGPATADPTGRRGSTAF